MDQSLLAVSLAAGLGALGAPLLLRYAVHTLTFVRGALRRRWRVIRCKKHNLHTRGTRTAGGVKWVVRYCIFCPYETLEKAD